MNNARFKPQPVVKGKLFGFHFDARGNAAMVVVSLGLIVTPLITLGSTHVIPPPTPPDRHDQGDERLRRGPRRFEGGAFSAVGWRQGAPTRPAPKAAAISF